jgi:hypothetical protein
MATQAAARMYLVFMMVSGQGALRETSRQRGRMLHFSN